MFYQNLCPSTAHCFKACSTRRETCHAVPEKTLCRSKLQGPWKGLNLSPTWGHSLSPQWYCQGDFPLPQCCGNSGYSTCHCMWSEDMCVTCCIKTNSTNKHFLFFFFHPNKSNFLPKEQLSLSPLTPVLCAFWKYCSAVLSKLLSLLREQYCRRG